jgi:hypothetical protein
VFEYLRPANKSVVDGLHEREVVFPKDQPEYNPLRALVSNTYDRKVITRWSFTEEQRRAIAEGADLFLCLMTFGEPLQPIQMFISDGAGERFAHWVASALTYPENGHKETQ